MIEWKRLYMKPAGSLPGGVVTQWGVGAITVFILLFLTYWIVLGGGEPEQDAALTEVATTTPRSFADQMTARVDAETMRAETNKAAAARALKQQQKQQAEVAGLTASHQAAVLAGPSPDSGQPYTEQEWELRENLRMEAIERRSRSLRSSPVAQTYRTLDSGGGGGGQERVAANPAPQQDEGAVAMQHAVASMHTLTNSLEDEIAAEAETDKALLAALTGRAITPEAAPPVPAPTEASAAPQDYSIPARLEVPHDPPGWERIYEGSFLEAVLATQLTGDYPGPVLAVVSVALLLGGSAAHPCPARNAGYRLRSGRHQPGSSAAKYRFSPLDLPRWKLGFAPISRAESAWRRSLERSNRPPLLFDVRSCWSSRRPQRPYGGRGAIPTKAVHKSMRSGAGQGLGQAATRILDRFLNRMPTITIRAGHRLARLVYIRRAGAPAHQQETKK